MKNIKEKIKENKSLDENLYENSKFKNSDEYKELEKLGAGKEFLEKIGEVSTAVNEIGVTTFLNVLVELYKDLKK